MTKVIRGAAAAVDVHGDRTVLVTGGRGFIGQSVCRLLHREGRRVISLDQSRADVAVDQIPGIRDVPCDISDATELERVFDAERIGGIIHLAAVLPTAAQRDPVRTTQVNVGGSLSLLEMARRFGVRRLVFGSSLSVYGTCAFDEIASETHRAAPLDLHGAAKLYVEQLGLAYRDCHGLEFASLRIGRVVGPGARSATSAWRSQIFEELRGAIPTEISLPFLGSEKILLVHVDDVARMLVKLLRAPSPKHGLYNACAESATVSQLKRELESLNPNLRVRLGKEEAAGNPRLLDSRRFEQEFDFRTQPIFTQLRQAAEKGS